MFLNRAIGWVAQSKQALLVKMAIVQPSARNTTYGENVNLFMISVQWVKAGGLSGQVRL